MTGAAIVIRGNAACLPLPDASVDLLVTSPPYFALRSYRDGDEHYDGQVGSEPTPQAFLEALWACTDEWWRVLKPTGSLWVNLGDKYAGSNGQSGGPSQLSGATYSPDGTRTKAAKKGGYVPKSEGIRTKSLMGLPWRYALGCIDRGWILRRDLIWSKPNGLPESVTDRCRSSHEYWFHLVKQGSYFSAMDEIREAHDDKNKPNGPRGRDGASAAGFAPKTKDGLARPTLNRHTPPAEGYNPLGKLPGSVWSIPTEPLTISDEVAKHYDLPDHFAAFPQEFPRRLILGWSPGGVCTACGEGRRPVAVVDLGVKERQTPRYSPDNNHGGPGSTLGSRGTSATITGYACACPDDSAPTRPSVVLDPFGGTGTTAGVARTLGRIGISVDLSNDYCRLARWRIFRSGHFSKTESRTHRDRTMAFDFGEAM